MRRLLPLLLLLSPSLALAHPGHFDAGHFGSGVAHPLLGPDHLLAMVAVGLWAAMTGGRALLAYPTAFLLAMLAGGLMGAAAISLPLVEPTILASVVVMGAGVALALNIPVWAAVPMLALFGAAHGVAHGAEGPGGVAYAGGFLLATAALHLAGMGLARLGLITARVLGGAVALSGAVLALA